MAETIQEIMTKASDYLNVTQNQASAVNIKKMTERVKELENENKQLRQEHQGELINM